MAGWADMFPEADFCFCSLLRMVPTPTIDISTRGVKAETKDGWRGQQDMVKSTSSQQGAQDQTMGIMPTAH